MSTEKDDFHASRAVAADYSDNQYHLMDQNTSRQWVLCSALGQRVIGTLEDKPDTAGDTGTIRHGGLGKVVLGGTVEDGDPLVSDADAHAIKKTGVGQHVFGRAEGGGVATNIISYIATNEGPSLSQEVQGMVSTVDPRVSESFGYGASKGLSILEVDGTAYSAAAAALNIMHFGSGNRMAFWPIVGQTVPPAMAAGGLDLQCDQAAADGWEIVTGILGTSGRPMVIGVDPAFYLEATFDIADVSGLDELHVGFRRPETLNATFDNYLDFATIGFAASADPAEHYIETILNNAGAAAVDTTDTVADGIEFTYRINVSAAGVVTFLIDGVAPSATSAYTFDDGDLVIPFAHALQHANFTEELLLTQWTVDYQ